MMDRQIIFAKNAKNSVYKKQKERTMTKDSQPDNRKARKKKSRGGVSITADGQNARRTTKRQSADRGDV